MIAIANAYLDEKRSIPNELATVIDKDLSYLMREWKAPSYDPWEEVRSPTHFFNGMVQRKALIEGGNFYKRIGDQRANYYQPVVNSLTSRLIGNWDPVLNCITETQDQYGNKGGDVDTSVLLGVLYGNLDNPNDKFAINSEYVLSTVAYLRDTFAKLYPINKK